MLVALTRDNAPPAPRRAAPVVPAPTPAPTPASQAAAAPAPVTGDGLAIGVTEQNPNLLWAPGERARDLPPVNGVPVGDAPQPFAGRAAELRGLHPRYFRLVVNWAALQPDPNAPPDLDRPDFGCMRAVQPCAGFGGLREELEALAARQREGGWEALVVILWTPPWATRAPAGCMPKDADLRALPPRADALPAYRRLIRAILDAADDAGATLRYWSPWNEPNHPGFILPQRTRCDPAAPSAAVAPYVAIARAMQAELAAAPGDQRIVLAETEGLLRRRATHTAADEFIDGLPTDLVCAADVWSTHAYLSSRDPVDAVDAAVRRHGCPKVIWVTETGIRGDGRRACERLDARLRQWYDDPRVGAAFQYTFREDDRFRTGLVSTDLLRDYPTLRAWEAWSADTTGPPANPCG